jgi:two-component system alkaline phosphatase synthesis response regulator PhoP
MELLVVEDNPSTLKMLAFLLRNEGYTVHAVSSAAAGLELLRDEPIDLLVLDVMLPDVSGLQICRQLRNEGLTIPILVISALGRRDDKLAALNEGADDYMTKPFDPSEVVARVHSLIRRTQPTLAPQLQTMLCVGRICLDAVNQCFTANGTGACVELTKMEAQLLHVLMRNAGQVVSHERLIAEAWGTDYEGSSNQLEVYVHRLRNKLRKEAPGSELIKTIQGSGYEFVAAGENVPQATTAAASPAEAAM